MDRYDYHDSQISFLKLRMFRDLAWCRSASAAHRNSQIKSNKSKLHEIINGVKFIDKYEENEFRKIKSR